MSGAWEQSLLDAPPGGLAGRLFWTLAIYIILMVLWCTIAARPTSARVRALVASTTTALRKSNPGCDPETCGSVKGQLATSVVSLIHSLSCGYAGTRCLFFEYYADGEIPMSVGPDSRSKHIELYACVTVAFFIGDLALCICEYRSYGPGFLFHAICGLVGAGWSLFTRQAHFYLALALCYEISTIFLNLATLIKIYAPGQKFLMMLNSAMLVLSFGTVRLVVGIPLCISMWRQFHEGWAQGDQSTAVFVFFTVLLPGLSALNIFWFYKLFSGMVKIVTGAKGKKTD